MDAHRFLYDVYLVSACSSETSCEYNCKTSSKWIYGCDSCQDVCPMNKGKWKGMEDFPGLRDIALYLNPMDIMEMDESYYIENIQPKFFYLSPEELWKWKANTLIHMGENYTDKYEKYIKEVSLSNNAVLNRLGKEISLKLNL